MHNKILINSGFFLMLLFAFMVSVYPVGSFFLAAAIGIIWLLDILIFKESDIGNLPLFYPLLGFVAILLFNMILSTIIGHGKSVDYVPLLSLFYFVVSGFVRSGERRRMILWSFIAGAIFIAGLQIILWWAGFSNSMIRYKPISGPPLFMIALAFSFLLSFYAESRSFSDKIFLALVSIPLLLVVILSSDKTVIFYLIIIISFVGIIRDRTVFIPFGLALLILFSGSFGIDYYFQQYSGHISYKEFLQSPVNEIREKSQSVLVSSFYGESESPISQPTTLNAGNSFFINLIQKSGPPAFLIFLWVLFERAREAYFKRRRLTANQPRAYHLIVLLTIIAIIIMNIYGAIYNYPSIILASWLILGMSET